MVEISNCREPCFAKLKTGCLILSGDCDKANCKWYKPEGCEDWIRSERGDEVWLIPPEEYYAEPVTRK